MKNVFRVFKRDILQLLKTPAALVVVIALLVLPSVYTWYNVLGFWNPYESTGNLRVDVVNEDAGGSSDLTGELDVGAMIVDELESNDQLGWHFTDYDEAMDDLSAGESYAVFVIPEDFTKSLLGLAKGNTDMSGIRYYVNEKTGPVSPKITDTGASTLDETINATFISTVSDVAVKALDEAIGEGERSLAEGTSKASQKAEDALGAIRNAQATIASVKDASDSARSEIGQARTGLSEAASKIDSASRAIPKLRSAASDAATKVSDAYDKASQAYANVMDAIMEMVDAIPDLSTPDAPNPSAPDDQPGPINLDSTSEAIAKAKELLAEARQLASALEGTLLPSAGTAATLLQSASTSLTEPLAGQKAIVEEMDALLDEFDGILDAADDSLVKTDSLLSRAAEEVESVRSDLAMLAGSDAMSSLFSEDGLDPERIADFMGTPTKIETEQLYRLNAYGSAMAPLFMNLTFWIGAFMLLVIMRQEVDSEGIRNLTLTQRYLGRFLLFAILAVTQATICVAGVLAIGLEAASPPALFLASALASLAYLSIIYAFSVTLQHIGKGICIILVFAQIPGATGLYPVEMTSTFFQTIYPFLPFTYGISAMRESICGFYGSQYAETVAMLGVFFVVFLLLGILTRPLMGNVNRMFGNQIKASGIFNGEDAQIPARTYRASQIVRFLADQDEFKTEMLERYAKFEKWRPRLIKASIVLGIMVPVTLMLVFALTPTEKVVLLTLWLIWMATLFVFLTILETLRFSLDRQLSLGGMSEDELREMMGPRNGKGRSAGDGNE